MKKIEKTQIESIKAIANSVREERQSLAGIINAIIDCGEQYNVARMLEVKLTATQSRKEQRNALYKAIADNYPVRQRTDAGVTPARFIRITCGKVIYAKLEQFSRYSFSFVQRAILNHLRGTAPLEYTGTWFSVGKEGSKNVYRSLTTVEIEQALADISLQREIDEAAASLRKSYLRAQSARLNKQATEQVAAERAAKEERKKKFAEINIAVAKAEAEAKAEAAVRAEAIAKAEAEAKEARKVRQAKAKAKAKAEAKAKEQQPEQSKEQPKEANKEA